MSLCETCAAVCKLRDKRGAEIKECRFYAEDIGATRRWKIERNITRDVDISMGAAADER